MDHLLMKLTVTVMTQNHFTDDEPLPQGCFSRYQSNTMTSFKFWQNYTSDNKICCLLGALLGATQVILLDWMNIIPDLMWRDWWTGSYKRVFLGGNCAPCLKQLFQIGQDVKVPALSPTFNFSSTLTYTYIIACSGVYMQITLTA